MRHIPLPMGSRDQCAGTRECILHDTVNSNKKIDCAILKWWMETVRWTMEVVEYAADT